MDKISVVTVCFNEGGNILETMLSVGKQTYKNIEYIIKDGMSTDNTNNIIEKYCEDNPDRCIKHVIKKDNGIYDAMNQAIDICTGDWVIFINAGDRFASLNVLYDIFGKGCLYNADILYGDVITMDISGNNIMHADLTKLPYKMPFSHQSCFAKADLLKKMRFNEKYKISGDFEFVLRCYEKRCIFFCTNAITAIYTLDGVSSTKYVEKVREDYTILKVHNIINLRLKMKYPFRMMMAWVKKMTDMYMPRPIQVILRRLYKHYVKGYEDISVHI